MDSSNEWTHPTKMPYNLTGNMWEYLVLEEIVGSFSPFLGSCSLGELTIVYMAFIGQKTSDNSLINFLDLKLS